MEKRKYLQFQPPEIENIRQRHSLMFSFLFFFVFIISINFDMNNISLHIASKICSYIRTQEERVFVESFRVKSDKIVITVKSKETKVSCESASVILNNHHPLKILANSGVEPKILIKLYKCYVRPIIEYGSASFMATSTTQFERLRRIQNEAIRVSLKLPGYINNII